MIEAKFLDKFSKKNIRTGDRFVDHRLFRRVALTIILPWLTFDNKTSLTKLLDLNFVAECVTCNIYAWPIIPHHKIVPK